jgi:hypothetical protein
MLLVYVPTKLGVSEGANVGVQIPAPWYRGSHMAIIKILHG